MSKEKQQIEEMARVLCEDCERDVAPCSLTKLGRMCDSVREQAEALYNAGYRKQSEGEWIKYPHGSGIYCSLCKHKRRYRDINDAFCPNCGASMKGGE